MMRKTGLLIFVLLVGFTAVFAQTCQQIGERLNQFLTTLSPEQIQQVSLNFEDSSRVKWTNLPVGMAKRPGIRYGDLSESSKIQFHHLLITLFSSQGYLKTTSIMKLDDIINEVYETAYQKKEINDDLIAELRALNWGYGNYYIAVWGKPGDTNPWGFKFGGHHISINLSAVGDDLSVTPFFLGADPAEVHTTEYAGLRVLSKEEDYGFQLINALSAKQQAIATLSKGVPADIITNPNSEQRITTYEGIKASDLNPEQQEYLKYIVTEYINNLEHEKAHEYLNKFYKTSLDSIYFAWIGSYIAQKAHYYVINSPTFLIEYDNMGFQKNGNHIHSIWREKGNDFGEDILKEHYLEDKHSLSD
ncbi:DUF3500 domain-containing protein [Mangrovibacterium lignilyticum]|uniref:DUF3500 domain-containing protein n=1 Tax=Mangrovibacterium lignilyticum TaxID=2668052 RepID=UPI0013D28901|nr:DUF3500 domain-containing protein [Mangrovibacterium lignilyticum]